MSDSKKTKGISKRQHLPQKGDKGTVSLLEQRNKVMTFAEAMPLRREEIGYAPNPISSEFLACGPLSQEDADFLADGNLAMFQLDDNKRIGGGIATSTTGVASRVLKCPMLLLGLTIDLDVMPYVTSVPGVLVPVTSEYTPAISRAAQFGDCKTQGNALVDYGYWIDQLVDLFFRYYEIQFDVGCDEVWLRTPLSHLGFNCTRKVERNGNPLIGVTEIENQVNKALLAQGKTYRFMATNTAESCSGCPNEVLGAPVAAAFGGGGCWSGALGGYFAAPTPYMLAAGQAIEVSFLPQTGFEQVREQIRNLALGIRTVKPADDMGSEIRSIIPTVTVAAGYSFAANNEPCNTDEPTVTVGPGDRVPLNLIYCDGATTRSRFGGTLTNNNVQPAVDTAIVAGADLNQAGFTVSSISTRLGSSEVTVIRAGCFKFSVVIYGVYATKPEALAMVREMAKKGYVNAVESYLRLGTIPYEFLEKIARKQAGVGVGELPEIVQFKKELAVSVDDNDN